MYLFPGEEALLPGAGGDFAPIYTCEGACALGGRPLACRIFPLTPVKKERGWGVKMDVRARAMCPLARSGTRGLDPEFVRAVREAVRLIAQDPEGEAFLERWAAAGGGVRGALEPFRGRWFCFAGGIWMKKRFLVCLLAALCCLFAVAAAGGRRALRGQVQRLGVPAGHAFHQGGAACAGAAGRAG